MQSFKKKPSLSPLYSFTQDQHKGYHYPKSVPVLPLVCDSLFSCFYIGVSLDALQS